MAEAAQRPVWRRPLWWALLAGVLLGHGLFKGWMNEQLLSVAQPPPMERLAALYTRQITRAAPAPAASPKAAAAHPRPAVPAAADPAAATAPQAAASDAVPAASDPPLGQVAEAPAAVPPDAAVAPMPVASTPPATTATPAKAASADSAATRPSTAASATGTAPAAAASVADAAPAGGELLYGAVWPFSTRMRYTLNGWYRGDVQGDAQVEWLRVGTRYQVHLDVSIGPSFAPLVRRRMSSEGQITPNGLAPQRYEQETRQPFGSNRAGISFEPELLRLANGRLEPRPLDVQDTASQFVQLIYLLTARPELRQSGASIEFALALPHRLDRWTYDIGPAEPVATPAGNLIAIHVHPRRRVAPGVLTVQMWLAPELQMMPVRIRIEQDEDTWADLRLKALPDQAGAP
ncbi:MAG: hypothetical protein RLY71_688 [Pseudomonadota bacterium]